jgi:hypothetical protein
MLEEVEFTFSAARLIDLRSRAVVLLWDDVIATQRMTLAMDFMYDRLAKEQNKVHSAIANLS